MKVPLYIALQNWKYLSIFEDRSIHYSSLYAKAKCVFCRKDKAPLVLPY